jgi:hypothetical protein
MERIGINKCERARAVFGRSAVASFQLPSMEHGGLNESRLTIGYDKIGTPILSC